MSASAARQINGELPLLCALGRHKTDPLVQWNDGYYFAKCRRCGLDLVRTTFGGWTVPRGYRVVWQEDAPRTPSAVRPSAARLVHAHAAPDDIGESESVAAIDDAPTHSDSVEAEADGSHTAAQVEFPVREPAEDAAADRFAERKLAFADTVTSETPSAVHAAEQRPGGLPAEPSFADDDAEGVIPASEPQTEPSTALPIEDVLRNLRTDPAPDEEPRADVAGQTQLHSKENTSNVASNGREAVESADTVLDRERTDEPVSDPPPAPPAPRYPVIPDFMDEPFVGIFWDPSTGRIKSQPENAASASQRDGEDRSVWHGTVRERVRTAAASAGRYVRPQRATSAVPDRSGGGQSLSFMERQSGVIAAAVFGGLVLAAAIVDARNANATRIAEPPARTRQAAAPARRPSIPQPAAAPSARVAVTTANPPIGDLAFVTVDLLKCRSVPADNGDTVRRLSRGAPVQILGADPGWFSILHQGRQCWAAARFISTSKPL